MSRDESVVTRECQRCGMPVVVSVYGMARALCDACVVEKWWLLVRGDAS